jgi:hypothetical protein
MGGGGARRVTEGNHLQLSLVLMTHWACTYPWTLQTIGLAVMWRLQKCMHNLIAKKFASTKHQRFHWLTDERHQHIVFYAHAEEVTKLKMLMEPTTLLPLHLTISYLQWHSICRPFVFWLLHTVEKFNTEMPADGNGSKGNSRCFQIVHIVPALYEHWIPCQMPLQRPHTQIMVWIYNWIFDRKRKSVIWNGFESFTCEDKQGPKLTMYCQRFTMWWYECALTRLIQVRTTINCGWDNKIYYCGRTFHASAPILMKLLCWLVAGQEEKQ